jgi:hypothetical protein
MRFGTDDQILRAAIVRALGTHGARVVPGPVDAVCEIHVDTLDPLATVRRTLGAALDRSVPDWQRHVTIFWTG